MSDEPNTYEYIIKKQAFLNTDALNERIAELEKSNSLLQEQNRNLATLAGSLSDVYRSQNLGKFLGFINEHLLAGDLEIEFHEEDEEGLVFHIPGAVLSDGVIGRAKKSFSVTGTLSLEWTAEVTAEDEDEAAEIAERHIHDADINAYFPHHEQVEEADIETYSLSVEVSDTYEN
jgi:hypothetical protein